MMLPYLKDQVTVSIPVSLSPRYPCHSWSETASRTDPIQLYHGREEGAAVERKFAARYERFGKPSRHLPRSAIPDFSVKDS